MSLLISAFGRFHGGDNCSELALEALSANRRALEKIWRDRVAFVLLPVDTDAAPSILAEAVARTRPTHVLLMGQAGSRAVMSLERLACNRRDFATPDDAGRTGALGPVDPDGPATVDATWPGLERIVAAAALEGVRLALSDDAGAHLCNQTLYLAAREGRRANPPFVATFLHLPLLETQVAARIPAALASPGVPGLPLDDMTRAVRAILRHTRGTTETDAGSRAQ